MADSQAAPSVKETDIFMLVSPVITFSSHALCIGAVYLASIEVLKRWIAISSLRPPAVSDSDFAIVHVPPRKGLKRIFNKDVMAPLLSFSFFASFQIFIHFILPKIKNQGIINTFWFTFCFLTFAFCTDAVARLALNPPTSAKLNLIKALSSTAKPSYTVQYDERARSFIWKSAVVAFTCAVSFVYYEGYELFTPIASAAWVLGLSSNFAFKGKFHMRYMLMVANGYIIAIPLLALIMAGVVELFSGSSDNEEPTQPKEGGQPSPSSWIVQMMLCYLIGMPSWISGMMISCAMRFDYSQSEVSTKGHCAPGESADIPKTAPRFPMPTFYAGLAALAVSIGGLKLANLFLRVLPEGIDMFYIAVTIPVPSIAMLLSAWSRGQLRDFWQYSETWTPTYDEAVAAKDDVEASPIEASPAKETEDEEERLIEVDEKEEN